MRKEIRTVPQVSSTSVKRACISNSNSFHVWSDIISVTSVLFMKLSIVLMLMAHSFWESVSGLGVTNAGTNNPFESNLTGQWTCIEHQCFARSRTVAGE